MCPPLYNVEHTTGTYSLMHDPLLGLNAVLTFVQLPENLRAPLILHMDDRQTVSDLKREAVNRVAGLYKEMGIPDGVRHVRLTEVRIHGGRVL